MNQNDDGSYAVRINGKWKISFLQRKWLPVFEIGKSEYILVLTSEESDSTAVRNFDESSRTKKQNGGEMTNSFRFRSS